MLPDTSSTSTTGDGRKEQSAGRCPPSAASVAPSPWIVFFATASTRGVPGTLRNGTGPLRRPPGRHPRIGRAEDHNRRRERGRGGPTAELQAAADEPDLGLDAIARLHHRLVPPSRVDARREQADDRRPTTELLDVPYPPTRPPLGRRAWIPATHDLAGPVLCQTVISRREEAGHTLLCRGAAAASSVKPNSQSSALEERPGGCPLVRLRTEVDGRKRTEHGSSRCLPSPRLDRAATSADFFFNALSHLRRTKMRIVERGFGVGTDREVNAGIGVVLTEG